MADFGLGAIPPPVGAGAGVVPGALGLGGLGLGGIPGFGLTGAFDASGGVLGGIPGGAYLPVTPLGGLAALKGDLIVPIIAVGVAIFLLLIIVLAVKAALAWKVDMLKGFEAAKFLRDVPTSPPVHTQERVNELASIVMDALDSERCLDKIICSIGSYGQGSSWSSYFSMVESLVSEDYRPKLSVMKSCAEGSKKVEDFQCGRDSQVPAGQSGQAGQQADAQQQGSGAAAKPGRLPLFATLGSNAALKPQAANNATKAAPTAGLPKEEENRI